MVLQCLMRGTLPRLCLTNNKTEMTKRKRICAMATMLAAVLCSLATSAQELPMSIEQMLQLADQNSTSIRAFQTSIEQADAALAAAKAERLPNLSTSLSFSYLGDGYIWDRDFSDGMSVDMPHFGNNFALKASQAVYTGGAITSGINLAKLQKQMAQLNSIENRRDVHFVLIGYYLQIFQLMNQERVFTQNIALTQQVIEQMKAKHQAGTALRNDITRYELQLKTLELNRTQVIDNRKIINHQLITVIGLPVGTEIIPDTTIIEHTPEALAESDWQHAATLQSTALQRAGLTLDISREREKLEKSELLPKVAIIAEEHLDGPVTIEVPALDNNFNYWYVGIGISYNISSLFKDNKKVKEAKIATRHAQEQYSLTQERVENAVQAAHTTLLTSFTELDTQQKSVDLATENYDVVSNRYNNELALITDLVDAANTKLSAELGLVNARINVIFNYYNMLYVSGQL